jgi:predicted acyltransferase
MQTAAIPSSRLDSIDIFRAVTMLIMIFVNDFWTLEGVPQWLEHSAAEDDAMGLSDVVFPAFLFIAGLSIPYAITSRKLKKDSNVTILTHIFERTFALLLMGIFTVNLETALEDGMVISKHVWGIAMVVGFLLIWNVYPQKPEKKQFYRNLKLGGILILLTLAIIYKGGDPENPSQMETQWWGILGLIGWSYFLCAPIYLFTGDNLKLVGGAWVFFLIFNLFEFSGLLSFLDGIKPFFWIVGSGSMPAFMMAGVTASVIYRLYSDKLGSDKFVKLLLLLGLALCVYGFATKPFWGISKIRATPAWVGICTGISFFVFTFFFWLTDLKKNKAWADIIRPAGTSTLTCYLVPYVWYGLVTIFRVNLPVFMKTGFLGLIKSFLFALIVIWVTGKLNKQNVKLKI